MQHQETLVIHSLDTLDDLWTQFLRLQCDWTHENNKSSLAFRARLASAGGATQVQGYNKAAGTSRSDAGEFFVRYGVENFEMFGMDGWIRPEGEFAEIALLHLGNQLLVLGPQPLQDARVDHDSQLKVGFVPASLFQNLAELALNFHAHGDSALDLATAFAVGAIIVNSGANAFRMALARHFHEPKLRYRQNMSFGLVAAEALFHALVNILLVAAVLHVDKVEHD